MQNIKPIYEFLLWSNCNNACTFCHQKALHDVETYLDDTGKACSMRAVMSFLQSNQYRFGSHILLVGGELFDSHFSAATQRTFNLFTTFMAKRLSVGKIDLLYLNTNLIYEDLTHLRNLLDKIKAEGLLHKVKFTTSYDFCFRFKDSEREQLMLSNLKTLHIQYPEMPVVVNTILTNEACQRILSHAFSVKNFCDTYSVQVNTIPYIILNPSIAASKDCIVNTLITIDKELPGYFASYVQNFALPQEKLLYEYHGGQKNTLVFCSSENAPCGHSINFKKYQPEQNSCFVCDMKKALEEYQHAGSQGQVL